MRTEYALALVFVAVVINTCCGQVRPSVKCWDCGDGHPNQTFECNDAHKGTEKTCVGYIQACFEFTYYIGDTKHFHRGCVPEQQPPASSPLGSALKAYYVDSPKPRQAEIPTTAVEGCSRVLRDDPNLNNIFSCVCYRSDMCNVAGACTCPVFKGGAVANAAVLSFEAVLLLAIATVGAAARIVS